MTYNPDIHKRHSIRLREYDYSSNGAYFITVCVQGRECLFGRIINGSMELNEAGWMVATWWRELSNNFPSVEIDIFVVMPNHFHGIVMINNTADPVGAIHELPLHQGVLSAQVQRRNMQLPKIIGYFKMNSAKSINILRETRGVPVWQRNYYERIIRNDAELDAARKYIAENPVKWAEDKENPENTM